MARITALLVVALAVAAFAEPLRRRRQTNVISTSGQAAGEAAGAANSAHEEAIIAVGGPGWVAPSPPAGGWGSGWVAEPAPVVPVIPAVIVASSNGDAIVGQQAGLTELTDNNSNALLVGIQTIDINQLAEGDTNLLAAVSGLDAAVVSIAGSDAAGAASSSAAGDVLINSS